MSHAGTVSKRLNQSLPTGLPVGTTPVFRLLRGRFAGFFAPPDRHSAPIVGRLFRTKFNIIDAGVDVWDPKIVFVFEIWKYKRPA